MGSRPNKLLIEERFKESIDAWVATARPTGSFLESVLSNDLKESIARGDDAAIANLPHIVAYLYNDCPAHCWGSPANVKAWPGIIDAANADAAALVRIRAGSDQ